jgi:hypothetical protein
MPHANAKGLLGKAYRDTFVLIAVGLVVVGIAVWFL